MPLSLPAAAFRINCGAGNSALGTPFRRPFRASRGHPAIRVIDQPDSGRQPTVMVAILADEPADPDGSGGMGALPAGSPTSVRTDWYILAHARTPPPWRPLSKETEVRSQKSAGPPAGPDSTWLRLVPHPSGGLSASRFFSRPADVGNKGLDLESQTRANPRRCGEMLLGPAAPC
jgi:hypothetical protein